MRRKLSLASGLFVVCTALLYQTACGGSSSPAMPTPPIGGGGASTAVSIVGINGNQSFAPNPVSIAVGQTIAWKNNDPGGNIHHIVADNGSFDAGVIGPGATGATVTVGNGAIPYHCANHPTMIGTINGSQGNGPTGPGY